MLCICDVKLDLSNIALFTPNYITSKSLDLEMTTLVEKKMKEGEAISIKFKKRQVLSFFT